MTRRLLPLLFCTLFAVNALASTEIEPEVLGPTAGNVSDLASANLGGKYLTVWRQLFMPFVGIWGAFTDADGKPLGPAFPVVAAANALQLRLYADGDSFLMVWNDSNQGEWICHVDNSGRATIPKQIYLDAFIRPDAFVDGRVIAVDDSINNRGATIFDDQGGTVRSGFAPAEVWQGQMPFAGNGSFFLAEAAPDLTLSRYTLDGDLLQTFTLETDQCATTTSTCWRISDVLELGSGTILLLLEGSPGLATMTITADGTMSEKTLIPNSFVQIVSATLQRTGSQIWAVLADGQTDGPFDVEARELGGNGIPTGDSVVLLRDVRYVPVFMTAIAEGSDSLLAVGVAGAPNEVETTLFRGGTAGDQQIVSISPSIETNTQVASNGTNYLAAWTNADGLGFPQVHWAVLDASGQRRSAVFADGGGMQTHSLVSNGQDYLMLIDGGGPLLVRRIAADGTLLGDVTLLGAYADWASGIAVAATSAGYVVAWSSGDAVSSAVVTPSGTVGTPQELLRIQGVPDGRVASYDNLALASNGSEVLLVNRRIEQNAFGFPGDPTDPTAELDAFRLGADGSLTTPDPLQLSSGDAVLSPPLAASDGQGFLVAADDERFEITATGVANMVETGLGATVTDLIWDGQSYVLSRDGDTFERVARDGSTLDAQSRRGVVGLDVAADSSGHLVLVGSENSIAGPLRAFSYTSADFLSLAKRRRAISP